MLCPACGFDNIAGTDQCENCHSSLTQEDMPAAREDTKIARGFLDDTVKELGPSKPIVISEETRLDEAFRTMRDQRIGCLLVTDSTGVLTGTLTEGDFMGSVAGAVDDLSAHRVAEFMNPSPESTKLDHPLAHAIQRMMVNEIRYLPLVDESGQPVGIVSSRDIVGYIAEHLKGHAASTA
jgi:CBS domain-containing protein